MSQLKKGAILSYVTIFLTNIIGLVLTPFIIKSLGDAEYGLYMLIGAFVGYISVMDLGLNNTIVRFVAKYRAEQDKEGEENFLGTTMLIYTAISIVVVLIGLVLYFNLETIFANSLTIAEMDKAKVMTAILIFNIAITLPGGAFTAICSGYEHFVYPRMVNILRYVVRSALVVALLLYGGDAIGLVLLDTAMNILVIMVNGYYVFKKLKVSFKLHRFEKRLIKDIFSYSLWIFIMALVYELQWRGGQVLVGIKIDTVSVAVYAVGVLLGTYYGAFASAINGVFLPRAMQLVVKKSSGKELTDMMIKIGRITFLVLLMVLGGFILFGKEFINLWVGNTFKDSWLIALLIMIASTNILVQSFADSLLRAKNLFKFKGLLYIFLIILGTIIGYFLIDIMGSIGMIWGICSSWFLSQMIMNIYFSKRLELQIGRFYKELVIKIIVVFSITLIIGYFIDKLFIDQNWINLLIKSSFYLTIYLIAMYFLVINSYEKDLIKKTFKVNA